MLPASRLAAHPPFDHRPRWCSLESSSAWVGRGWTPCVGAATRTVDLNCQRPAPRTDPSVRGGRARVRCDPPGMQSQLLCQFASYREDDRESWKRSCGVRWATSCAKG
ncbi:hypothetical protein SETIT_5G119900v2 [Setaria italica]|uniref:Uncharacterized protein n=1 Tax=Setaria italica TaxID=4555 RepID=A0A368R3T6_SETIT|nr:hypothetical protein SETIT_5G119900v2 [Setaria italica]